MEKTLHFGCHFLPEHGVEENDFQVDLILAPQQEVGFGPPTHCQLS